MKKVDGSSQDEDEDDEKGKGSGVDGERGISHSGDAKKRRRAWELWSLEDKNTFFEAINECGKDFEAIQNFLLTKLRKKGIPTCVIKNKDQVRHFYYRTWHKISKHIKFSDNVKKSTQELYTLINYGELRRKVGGTLDEKKGQKLQELIQKGSTSVRIKGKSIRVRTPICRALKKLNEFPDDRDQAGVRVPVTISVEIVPGSINSWNHVQSLAHNPRIRISCSMHKTVASIIDHLQTKWKSTKHKLCDNLITSANFPVDVPPTPLTYLRLRPPTVTDFNIVNIKPDTQVKSYAVSLSSHSQMLQRKGEAEMQNAKGRTCKPRKKKSSSSTGENSKDKPLEEVENKEETKDDDKVKEEEEPAGEISQEEAEEGSDDEVKEEQESCSSALQVDSSNSTDDPPSNKEEEVVILSCNPPKQNHLIKDEIPPKPPPKNIIPYVLVKEEPFQMPPNYEEEVLSAVKNIKEEVTDSMETIHQLMALENVANTQEINEDADVICIGESTRLSAQIRENQKKSGEQSPNAESRKIQEQEEPSKTSTESQCDTGNASVGGQTYSSFAQCINRAKEGWTAKTCGIITVGELYLMFGKNQQITLEYEFEDSESPEEVPPNVGSSCSKEEADAESSLNSKSNTEEGLKSTESIIDDLSEKGLSIITSSCLSPPSSSQLPSLKVEPSVLASPLAKNISSPEGEESSSNLLVPPRYQNNILKDNKKIAEDISSMMAKLLYMIKIMSSKGSNDLCVCGNTTLSKNALNNMRSPSNARCLNGFFKSPGNSKSPRGCSVSMRSPRTPTLNSSTMSPGENLNPAQKSEKTKPSSAKRLITDSSEKGVTPNANSDSISTIGKEKGADSQEDKISVTGVKPFDTNSANGEFRIPVAPAPRNHGCQSPNPSFNAQLSKLLPRYSRPSRRSARKNMVVQRQLPLLPRLPKNSQGFVTLKVGNLEEFNIAAAPSHILNLSIAPNPPCNETKIQSATPNESIPPTIPSLLVQQQQPLSPETIPVISDPFTREIQLNNLNDNSNAISVNVSGHQLLTVKMPTYPFSTNNVTTMSSVASVTQSTSVSLASSDCVTTTATCALPLKSVKQASHTSDTNGYALSNILSQTLSDLPYLTTPPSTPIGSNTSHLDSLLNTPTPKPELGRFIETSNASLLSMDEIEMASLPLKSGKALPPVSFSESSLLSTPTHFNQTGDRISDSSISPIKLNLSSFLSSPNSRSPDKSLDILLNNPQGEPVSSQSERLIPQIHIPECSDNLPILDISIGGTISVQERSSMVGGDPPVSNVVAELPVSTSGILSNLPLSPESNTGISLSVTCVTTPTTSSEMSCGKVNVLDESLLHPFQESNDKIMDITLANSNSNSSFSGLLAAAVNHPCLDSIMENSLLQTPPRPLLSSGVTCSAKSNLSLDGEGFETLSAVPLSPPSSPSRLLRQTETQWMHNEANEFSLSSLLGTIESPNKGAPPSLSHSQSSQMHALISTLNDNSVDFTATFARLKNQTKDKTD